MKDILTESIVPVKPRVLYQLARIAAMALLGLGVLGLMLFLFQSIAVAAVCLAVAVGSYYLMNKLQEKTAGEFEYIHSNGQLDVDIVVNASRRKHLMTVDLERVVLLAPAEHWELERYNGLAQKDFTGGAEENTVYCMVFQDEGKSKKLLLSLNEKMYNSLKSWLRSKVKE